MLVEVALLAVFLALGLALQRRDASDVLRERAWAAYWWTVTPTLVFTSFSTVEVDRELGLALAAAVLASWLVIALGYAYAQAVARERDERGALALGAGFPNTGFVGYPLAQLALGNDGLALMVLYDRLGWLVPSTAISTAIARLHGRRDAAGRASARRRLRLVLVNPPLVAAVAAVALRAAGVDVAGAVEPLGRAASAVVGPAGFFLLGLVLPLEPPAHDLPELRKAGGVLAIRFGAAPLVLLGCGAALGTDLPAAFLLGAAMPCAFHLLVLARVFDVRPQLVRLLVVGSTVPAVVAVVAASAFVGR
ncbi:MAG TPA: AEC family transporter [Gaiellaceae bacterium]|nr:AEC family transporter [Gaiellaceae bacterium]